MALCKKCPYLELFCFAFSRIQTEYGEISSYSVRMRENATRVTPNTENFPAVWKSIEIDEETIVFNHVLVGAWKYCLFVWFLYPIKVYTDY